MKIYNIIKICLLFVLISFSSLAYSYYGNDPYGIFMGIWDGAVWPAHLIEKIFTYQEIYRENNTGFTYGLGFFVTFLAISWNYALFLSFLLLVLDILTFFMQTGSVGETVKILFGIFVFFVGFGVVVNGLGQLLKSDNKNKELPKAHESKKEAPQKQTNDNLSIPSIKNDYIDIPSLEPIISDNHLINLEHEKDNKEQKSKARKPIVIFFIIGLACILLISISNHLFEKKYFILIKDNNGQILKRCSLMSESEAKSIDNNSKIFLYDNERICINDAKIIK